jgi:putative membrane protein
MQPILAPPTRAPPTGSPMTTTMKPDAQTPVDQPPTTPSTGFLARAVLGGALMGLANLVPGISGGTMLVAAGVYTRFIDAISDATRFRLNRGTLLVLGAIGAAAAVAIGGLAGVIALGLAEFRWGMYSLFIGLTLGGVPIMLKMTRPLTPGAIAGALAGIAVMIALVVLQGNQPAGGAGASNPFTLALAGAAGASAMILPGVSGAYLLLILGQYETIIGAIKDAVKAASSGDIAAALAEAGTLVPVGVGVVLGIVVIGNLLRFVLHRYEKATLGVLLGLLVAAPAGLYPFKEGVRPQIGEVFEDAIVTEASLKEIDPKDWPERSFIPGAGHIAGSLALIAAGVVATLAVARLGSGRSEGEHDAQADARAESDA